MTRDDFAIARSAARSFCRMHRLRGVRSIDGPPVLGPVRLMRDGRPVVAYRWLGSGRGEDYVQVELDGGTGEIVVRGAHGHDALPEWRPRDEPRAGPDLRRGAGGSAMHDVTFDPEKTALRPSPHARTATPQQDAGRFLAPASPARLGVAGMLHLQRVAGNASVVQMLAAGDAARSPIPDDGAAAVQRESAPEAPQGEEEEETSE